MVKQTGNAAYSPAAGGDVATQRVLIIGTVLYGLLLVPACIMAPFSVLAFDGPDGFVTYLTFLLMGSFPVTIAVSLGFAWVKFRQGRYSVARLWLLIPLAQILVSLFVPGFWGPPG
jgi:hypothetical protein